MYLLVCVASRSSLFFVLCRHIQETLIQLWYRAILQSGIYFYLFIVCPLPLTPVPPPPKKKCSKCRVIQIGEFVSEPTTREGL